MKLGKLLFIPLLTALLFSCVKKETQNEENIDAPTNIVEESFINQTNQAENKVSNTPIYRELPVHKAYHFEPGYYYMLDSPVRIRKEPNLDSEVIGTLGLNSKIRIISTDLDSHALEIDGISALWYEIEYENITGFIWGGYISAKTLIYDIDNNGIDDYFHFRVSKIEGPNFYSVNAMDDVIIYLNNKKISTENIYVISARGTKARIWGSASFEITANNTVLIIMYTSVHGFVQKDTFEMNAAGKIVLIDQFYESYE
jgi:hypothetical protein